MKNELQFSKKSQEFTENLRLYLFSSGKNPDEIEDIVNQLEDHLFEAEKKGKPIEKIIGKSPKEYMKMVSNEMAIDYQTWFTYICFFVLGSFSFSIFIDLWEGNLSYSILEIIGHIVILAIFLASFVIGAKLTSTTSQSRKIQGMVIGSIAILPLTMHVGLIYLTRVIDTPIIHFGNIGSLVIGVIAAITIIVVSIWAKSWILIIIMAFLMLPNYLLSLTSLQENTQMIISAIVTYGGIGIYLWILSKLKKDN